MEKFILTYLLIMVFLFSCSSNLAAQKLEESRPGIESSIVLLTLMDGEITVDSDPFFELYYFTEEDYILLPANLLSPYLEVDLNFKRDISLLSLRKGEREVRIDLNQKEYLDQEEWNDQPPLIVGGEFYLSKKVFSYLGDYNIVWNNALQELIISGDFVDDYLEEFSEDQEDQTEAEKKEITEKEEVLGSANKGLTLSSIHYRIELNMEDDLLTEERKEIRGDLNFYGRYNDWAYYINNDLEYDLDLEVTDYTLDKIKFSNRENNRLIIIGDHEFYFKDTIKRNDMQGIYFRFPENLQFKLIPYTAVSVDTKAEDEVTIFINNKFIVKKVIKKDGVYEVNNLELRANYLNKIVIEIISKDGNKKEIIKYLSGSKDILQPKVKEIEFFAGRYRDRKTDFEDWQGNFAALRSNYALTEHLTYNLEAAFYDKEEVENEMLSAVTGFNIRLGGRTVLNLDFLVGGEIESLESGAEASFLYSLMNGYFRGIYAYIPPELEAYLDREEGEKKSLNFKLDLTERLSIQPTIGNEESLYNGFDNLDDQYERDYYIFQIIDNPNWRNYSAFSFRYEEVKEFDGAEIWREIANPFGPSTFFKYGSFDTIKKGANIYLNRYGSSYRFLTDLDYYENEETINDLYINNNFIGKVDGDDSKEYEAEFDFYKRLGETLLFSGSFLGEKEEFDSGRETYERQYNLQTSLYLGDRTTITLKAERDEDEEEDEDDDEDDDYYDIEETTSLKLDYYFNSDYSISAELKDYQTEYIGSSNFLADLNRNYQSVYLSGNYYFPNNPGYIQLFAEYILPEVGESGISYGFVYDKIRDNESGIIVEIGREYEGYLFGESKYENYAMISYSHALSFSGGNTVPTRFSDGEPRSMVTGYVFLDENYNGQMDDNERRLPDMPMRLGSLRTRTNEEGFYIFKPYFNDIYLLDFDYNNLTADYTPVTENVFVKVRYNQNIHQNYGVTINGSISGRVYLDKNADGQKNENEEYLDWVGLSIKKLNKKDYTDGRGKYYFENIPLGNHQLEILKDSLPAGLISQNGYQFEIFITEDNLDYRELDIALIYGD